MPKTTTPDRPAVPEGAVRLSAVRETPLSVDEVMSAVRSPECGGVVLFEGLVRDHDGGPAAVLGLSYSAHPSAQEVLGRVCAQVAEQHPGVRVAAVHRVGELSVGDSAVLVAAAAPHRGEAFEAGRALIDTLKQQVPIWKHQRFADGSDEWVGMP